MHTDSLIRFVCAWSWNYCELFKWNDYDERITVAKAPHSLKGSQLAHNHDNGNVGTYYVVVRFVFVENARRLLQNFRFADVIIVKFSKRLAALFWLFFPSILFGFFFICIFDGLETAIENLHFTFHTNVYLIFIVLCSGCMVER